MMMLFLSPLLTWNISFKLTAEPLSYGPPPITNSLLNGFLLIPSFHCGLIPNCMFDLDKLGITKNLRNLFNQWLCSFGDESIALRYHIFLLLVHSLSKELISITSRHLYFIFILLLFLLIQ
jgi:hypothetical protein